MSWHYVITDQPGWTTPYSQDQEDNAQEVWNHLRSYNWSEESCAAVISNLQTESYLNPGQWEIGSNYDFNYGTGLGQWTPATKVSNYIHSTNLNRMANGYMQMELLIDTPDQYQTYYLDPDGSSTYYGETGLPYIDTMAAFSRSGNSIQDLTKLWAICWERPSAANYHRSIADRLNQANYWYNLFHGLPPVGVDIIPVLFLAKIIR